MVDDFVSGDADPTADPSVPLLFYQVDGAAPGAVLLIAPDRVSGNDRFWLR